jgi:hypothetical protein
MKPLAVTLCALLALGTGVLAQHQPFDMTPERPVEEAPFLPAPTTRPAAPDATVPEAADEDDVEATAPEPVEEPAGEWRRALLPSPVLRLEGENDLRRFAFYLTDAQAASTANLRLGYQNAVVVAPEASRLVVDINGVRVAAQSIASADGVEQTITELPAGLLRPGRNEIAFLSSQRHRTDCSISSTYELWTELDARTTYLSLDARDDVSQWQIADLKAIPGDNDGQSKIVLVVPSLATGDVASEVLRLAQAVALLTNLTNPRFQVTATLAGDVAAGANLLVVAGTTAEVGRIIGEDAVPSDSPSAAFRRVGEVPAPVLVLSGADRSGWIGAIEQLAAQAGPATFARRETLETEAWNLPNVPMLYEGRDISFGEMGVTSEQFSGRRYVRRFRFAIPADFYAQSYGEARILLDAAYTDEVRPGSVINIYVNGNIATTMPITTRGGRVLRQFPIDLTKRHFRPGVNEVVVEAGLLTDADEVCAPGGASDAAPRFALFDSSRFSLPDFARIAQVPNLAATSGTGFPYLLNNEPVPVIMGRGNMDTLSAAASVMGRIAVMSGRILPVRVVSSPLEARGRDAIFLGTPVGLDAAVLAQVGIDDTAAASWASSATLDGQQTVMRGERLDLETWRTRVGGDIVSEMIEDFRAWLRSTFDISIDMLRFVPQEAQPYAPTDHDVLIVAQATSPSGRGTWTVITAPDEAQLAEAAQNVVALENWRQLSDALTIFSADGTINTIETTGGKFFQTVPPSLGNYRLIVANWLSSHILSYSAILIVACALLGVATAALLSRLGRRG